MRLIMRIHQQLLCSFFHKNTWGFFSKNLVVFPDVKPTIAWGPSSVWVPRSSVLSSYSMLSIQQFIKLTTEGYFPMHRCTATSPGELILAVSLHLSLQILRYRFAQWPQHFDGFKKSHWVSVRLALSCEDGSDDFTFFTCQRWTLESMLPG